MQFKKTQQALELETQLMYLSTDDELPVRKYKDLDFTPIRSTEGSAGYDLFACIPEPIIIYPDEVVKISTGVHIWLDDEELMDYDVKWCGLLLPRSSNTGCILNNTVGLLDSDYQGELFAKWRNVTAEPITFVTGQKFCQLVIVPAYIAGIKEVSSFETTTGRAEGGFGSTGK